MYPQSTNRKFLPLLLFITVCNLFIACNDENEPNINSIAPCQIDIGMDRFGIMNVNEDSYFIESSFIGNSSLVPDSIRRLDISGFTKDCERRDEVKLTYFLPIHGDHTGSFNITSSPSNIPGSASGTLLIQVVATLEQEEVPIESGTFIISEDMEGELSINLNLETVNGDVISIDSPIEAN